MIAPLLTDADLAAVAQREQQRKLANDAQNALDRYTALVPLLNAAAAASDALFEVAGKLVTQGQAGVKGDAVDPAALSGLCLELAARGNEAITAMSGLTAAARTLP